MLSLHLLEFIRGDVVIGNGQFLHGILVVAPLHQVHRPICPFPYQVDNLVASYELFGVIPHIQEFSHSIEVFCNVIKAFYWQLFVNFSEQRDISLKVFIEVANVDECSENFWRKDQLEGLPVLLNGVQEPKGPKAVQLDFVLELNVLALVGAVGYNFYSFLLLFFPNKLVFYQHWTIVH